MWANFSFSKFISVCVAVAAIFLWQGVRQEERVNFQKLTQIRAEYSDREIVRNLKERGLALERMAARLSHEPDLHAPHWESDAESHRKHYPEIDSIFILGAKGEVRWASGDGNAASLHEPMLRSVQLGNEPQLSTDIPGDSGDKHMAISLPILRNRKLRGHLVGILDANKFFSELNKLPYSRLRVASPGGNILFSNLEKVTHREWAVESAITEFWGSLSVYTVPSVEAVRRGVGHQSTIVLITGFAIAVLFWWIGHLAEGLKHSIRAAAVTNKRLETLLDFAPVGIIQADNSGNCISANRTFLEITGITEASCLGVGWQTFISPRDRAGVVQNWQAAVEGNQEFSGEIQFTSKEKNSLVLQAQGAVVRDQAGQPLSFMAAFLNVTEKKVLEHTMAEQRSRLAYMDKMSALGEMAAGIGHEINNPLTIIGGSASVLLKATAATEIDRSKVNRACETILSTVDRMAKIIRGLQTFSRDGSADPLEIVPVREVVEEALGFCRGRFGKSGVSVKLTGLEKGLLVACRRVQLSQVFLNLLTNSFHAVKNQPDAWVEIVAEAGEGGVKISILDSGNRIPEKVAAKIMQPFFTTKEVGAGTGLGLAISNNIVESHGGKLYLDRSHQSTCFTIEMPGPRS